MRQQNGQPDIGLNILALLWFAGMAGTARPGGM